MLDRNLFDEAARVLAIPIPRRKALTHLAAGFAGALLSFLWPKQALAGKPCGQSCPPADCIDQGCYGKSVGESCIYLGKAGYCEEQLECNEITCCHCIPG